MVASSILGIGLGAAGHAVLHASANHPLPDQGLNNLRMPKASGTILSFWELPSADDYGCIERVQIQTSSYHVPIREEGNLRPGLRASSPELDDLFKELQSCYASVRDYYDHRFTGDLEARAYRQDLSAKIDHCMTSIVRNFEAGKREGLRDENRCVLGSPERALGALGKLKTCIELSLRLDEVDGGGWTRACYACLEMEIAGQDGDGLIASSLHGLAAYIELLRAK